MSAISTNRNNLKDRRTRKDLSRQSRRRRRIVFSVVIWTRKDSLRQRRRRRVLFFVVIRTRKDSFKQRRRRGVLFLVVIRIAMTMGAGFPVCVQCGTHDNPCRCKVVGPTLGFAAFMVAALVEWPVGALVYCFRHPKGRRIMSHPATVVFPSVSNAIPF